MVGEHRKIHGLPVYVSNKLFKRWQREAKGRNMTLRSYVHYLFIGKDLDEYLKKKLGIVS
jgi:hypothetical protein